MNTITQTEASAASGYTAAANKGNAVQGTKSSQTSGSESVKKTKVTNGRTIGEPKLSEKGQKYYDKLRKKYSNMDFILVSEDKKAEAQANAGKYANANRMVVLVDEEKIERMAEDEEYRKKYEGIIASAGTQLSQIKNNLGANAGSVKTYGMQIDDGGNASFFAVIDKSLAAQRSRIEKRAAEKKAAQKAAEKKQAEEKRTEKADEKKKAEQEGKTNGSEDTVTVTASSAEELLRKINDTIYAQMSDNIWSEEERKVGQKFDFSI